VNCQRFTITNVAFSASWTHKHDGDYMHRFFKTIFVDVGVGANRQKYFNTRGDKQDIFFTRKI